MSFYEIMLRRYLENRESWLDGVESALVMNGLSQAALARESGMDRAQLNRYLTRTQTPELESMLRIDEALDRLTNGA